MARWAVDSAGVWKTRGPSPERLLQWSRFPHPLENAPRLAVRHGWGRPGAAQRSGRVARVSHTAHSHDDDFPCRLLRLRMTALTRRSAGAARASQATTA